ncbi:MAG TPA: hypothetical protein QF753_09020 [Victivallales bacterium]|nr:hypothetical protein [Victivallales bacterium]
MNSTKFIKLLGCFIFICTITTNATSSNTQNITPKESDKITFITGERIPENFDSFTFYWKMPKIEKGAVLKYTVSIPGHNNLYSYKLEKQCPSGENIRSDFTSKLLKGIHQHYVKITFSVNKGKIRFINESKYNFIFRKKIKATMEK